MRECCEEENRQKSGEAQFGEPEGVFLFHDAVVFSIRSLPALQVKVQIIVSKKKRESCSDLFVKRLRHAHTQNKQYPPRHADILFPPAGGYV